MRARVTSVGLGVMVAAVAVAGCAVQPTSDRPTAQPSKPSASAASPSPSGALRLGPDGYGSLKLGMSKAEAAASGVTTGISGTSGTCGADGDGRLQGALPADNSDLDGKLFFSVNTGTLVIIGATSSIATPEGVHLGSTVKDVKKAYPKWKGSEGDQGLGFVKVAGNSNALYRIYIDADQVMELTLQTVDQDCAE